MKRLALLLLLFSALLASAQASDEGMYGALFSVLSYLGILLLSLLFSLIVAIPFIDEILERKEIKVDRSPLSNRLIWATEISLGIFLVSMTVTSSIDRPMSELQGIIYVIAAICAILPFAIFLVIAFISNVYKRGLLENLVSMLLWGVVASSAALFINQGLKGMLSHFGQADVALLILAAFFEEALKGIGLAEAIKRRGTPPVLGMLYGFAIGIGFSLVENWLYFTYVTNPFSVGTSGWTQVLFYRSFFTTLAHGLFTAFNAYLVCRLQKTDLRFLAGLGLAFLLHVLYNTTVLTGFDFLGPFVILAMAFGFLYIAYREMKTGANRLSTSNL